MTPTDTTQEPPGANVRPVRVMELVATAAPHEFVKALPTVVTPDPRKLSKKLTFVKDRLGEIPVFGLLIVMVTVDIPPKEI